MGWGVEEKAAEEEVTPARRAIKEEHSSKNPWRWIEAG